MTWRCALIQARLPAYPDGELSPFWRRLIEAHLKVCPDCRRELEELAEVARLYQSQPLPEPDPQFWQEFERELHVKLAEMNQSAAPRPRRLRLAPYVLGAAALAGIAALAVYLGPFSFTSPTPRLALQLEEPKSQEAIPPPSPMAAKKAPAVRPEAKPVVMGSVNDTKTATKVRGETGPSQPVAPPPPKEAEVSLAAGKAGTRAKAPPDIEDIFAEDDILSWDVDSLVADLSPEEQRDLKDRLESRR